MAYQCFNCHKKNWMSVRSQHHKGVAGGSWKHKAQKSAKLFRVNLHSQRFIVDGSIKRVRLCSDCLSLLRRRGRLARIEPLAYAKRPASPPLTPSL